MDGVTHTPQPVNEPTRTYAPGTAERASLQATLKDLSTQQLEFTQTIGGHQALAGGERFEVVSPHRHSHVVGIGAQATEAEVSSAIGAALNSAARWAELSFDDRAAVLLKAADLLAGPWRDRINAATMLGQSKSCYQAEIDAACEMADFWRFNVHFAREILDTQPISSSGVWNRMDYRPLEGFVLAITPFNFTAIAGNLPTAPALMGNTVVWKPSPTQQLAAHLTLRLLEEAGLPPGVINMVTGDGAAVSSVALTHRDLSGIHFTGSTKTFQHLWSTVGRHISGYRSYPRLVGETGGKDFVLVHPSSDSQAVVTALVRGAFEYQGQKCSAASRAYLPKSLWDAGLRDNLAATTESLTYGDVADFSNFGGAVIDRRAFDRLSTIQRRAAADPDVTVIAGGTANDSEGYFVRPTVVEVTDPHAEYFKDEYFGPFLAVHVFEDADYDDMLSLIPDTSEFALTGSIFGQDRRVLDEAMNRLRFAAGNFYLNDKPTGAVVGQQPFGGARASGTNDKAGSVLNLLRWASPRTIKETFVPPHDHRYPHMS